MPPTQLQMGGNHLLRFLTVSMRNMKKSKKRKWRNFSMQKVFGIFFRKKLLAGTVPAKKKLLAGTVSA